jgi:hypothetical protein
MAATLITLDDPESDHLTAKGDGRREERSSPGSELSL